MQPSRVAPRLWRRMASWLPQSCFREFRSLAWVDDFALRPSSWHDLKMSIHISNMSMVILFTINSIVTATTIVIVIAIFIITALAPRTSSWRGKVFSARACGGWISMACAVAFFPQKQSSKLLQLGPKMHTKPCCGMVH